MPDEKKSCQDATELQIAILSEEELKFLKALSKKTQRHILRINQTAFHFSGNAALIKALEKDIDEGRIVLRFSQSTESVSEVLRAWGGNKNKSSRAGLNEFFIEFLCAFIEKAKNGKKEI